MPYSPTAAAVPAIGVGARLRQTREARQITLQQIADITKISPGVLEAIERDDLKRLPGGIFTRSFVRAYASQLGVDPERTLREFLAQFPEGDREMHAATTPVVHQEIEPNAGIPRGLLQLAIVSLPLVIAVLWFGIRPASERERSVAARRADAMESSQPLTVGLSPVANLDDDRRPTVTLASLDESRGLTIVLTPQAECWISASADGRPIVERLLAPGESTVLRGAREVSFKVGDAGAVALRINGATGRALGRPGQVVFARIDQQNYREYLAQP
jgi:cytoskeleton protein RodZ